MLYPKNYAIRVRYQPTHSLCYVYSIRLAAYEGKDREPYTRPSFIHESSFMALCFKTAKKYTIIETISFNMERVAVPQGGVTRFCLSR